MTEKIAGRGISRHEKMTPQLVIQPISQSNDECHGRSRSRKTTQHVESRRNPW